ncbi:uncharacterized protein CMU_035320 [Cryptosporidium muris RN66]|uniref:Uncharacterized protein n=1 Tax=Cryptosporidium muris (strain RN66) TaxID=441375 RepID=B6AGM0_CRYMR|nr:uncharacterized protein CMU_035320 [Cryptosporidium muris RN66]EEA07361.1 hypothetical protein CMU_035320 [Cryptosporidium muris RN66]|eukprot:XP_002141710.1 hypothetical protein [Cryptosporidium muris RN66]
MVLRAVFKIPGTGGIGLSISLGMMDEITNKTSTPNPEIQTKYLDNTKFLGITNNNKDVGQSKNENKTNIESGSECNCSECKSTKTYRNTKNNIIDANSNKEINKRISIHENECESMGIITKMLTSFMTCTASEISKTKYITKKVEKKGTDIESTENLKCSLNKYNENSSNITVSQSLYPDDILVTYNTSVLQLDKKENSKSMKHTNRSRPPGNAPKIDSKSNKCIFRNCYYKSENISRKNDEIISVPSAVYPDNILLMIKKSKNKRNKDKRKATMSHLN